MIKIKDKSSVVADTIHGQILISRLEKEVIATTLFNRLHGIYQNSTAYLTFSTNRTKRVEHSFGTMYLCGEIFRSSVCNSPEDEAVHSDFFHQASSEINSILTDISRTTEYSHKLGQLVRQINQKYSELQICGGIYDRVLPSNVKEDDKKIFIIVFESVRIAALLHDVGHPPFSHVTEFALQNIYKKIVETNVENERTKLFKEIMDSLFFSKREIHEEMGISIAIALFEDLIKNISETQARDSLIYGNQLFRLIIAEMVHKILSKDGEFCTDLYAIISGTLDGDRLDYVSRDPLNSGFSTGIIEYDRLITSMKLIGRDSHFLFCPSTSVVNTIEDFLMRRWNMYRNIIYHHRVVKTDYLLQKSIEELAITYLLNNIKEEELKSYILPYDISGLWKALMNQTSVLERGYSISQWDDIWLMTILKKEYFEKYLHETDSVINKLLKELLTSQKMYASLIKRKEEFEVVDTAVARSLADKAGDILGLLTKIEEQESSDDSINFDGFVNNIKRIVEMALNYNINTSLIDIGGFILVEISKTLKFGNKDNLKTIIEETIEEFGLDKYFVVFKYPKTGTSKDLYICKKYNGEAQRFNSISDIHSILTNNLKLTPFFFIYIDNEMTKTENFDFNNERKRIGIAIANGIYNWIEMELKSFLK